MRTERTVRLVGLLLAALFLVGVGAAGASAADDPAKHASVGPPAAIPDAFEGLQVGIDEQGHYCVMYEADPCRAARAGELPGTVDICEGADGRGSTALDCSDAGRTAFEMRQLEKWRQSAKSWPQFDKLNAFITDCVKEGKTFKDCQVAGGAKYPSATGPGDWVAGKISELASNALQEAARYIGQAVVWLLEAFAKVFASASTVDLAATGVGQVTGMATALSAVLAVFLLLLQFGKVSVSRSGEPAATAVIGLVKWAVISAVYWGGTQVALTWADAVSDWIIKQSFASAGSTDATTAMQQQLGKLFGGLITGGGGTATVGAALITGDGVAAAAVGVVLVLGIVCILAIGALWLEILMRQAGIMILVATMPIVLTGQLTEGTSEWWPKARNALIGLILMKPAITLCFAIGFGAMTQGQGIQNMMVGLMIFLTACFAWPAIAKFMTFTTAGGGSSVASGVLSSAGSSAGSISGGYRPEMGGAGAVGGGSNYTRALEQDTAQTANSGSNAAEASASGTGGGGGSRSGRFGGKVAGTVGLGLQALAVGKDVLESGMASTAAHAGLDQGGGGGRHVVIPPRRTHSGPGPVENGPQAPQASGGTTEIPPAPTPGPAPVPHIEQLPLQEEG